MQVLRLRQHVKSLLLTDPEKAAQDWLSREAVRDKPGRCGVQREGEEKKVEQRKNI